MRGLCHDINSVYIYYLLNAKHGNCMDFIKGTDHNLDWRQVTKCKFSKQGNDVLDICFQSQEAARMSIEPN